MLKLLIEHNYRLLEKDGGKKHQPIRSWQSLVGLEKMEQLLGRQPKLKKFSSLFSISQLVLSFCLINFRA